MIDFTLTEEQKLLQQTARRFAKERIRPVAAEVDRNPDPDNWPRELFKEAAQLGFTKMLVPEKYGGLGMGLLDLVILMEELGWGDAGFANSIGTTAFCILPLALAGNEYQKQNFLVPFMKDESGLMMAAPGTEPEGGSEPFCPEPDPKLGMHTTARKEGKEWVLNGAKAWASNAGIAWLYLFVVRTDPKGPNIRSNTAFLVPADTPGITFGHIENKLGRRIQRNQEIFLENVRVPEENALGKIGGAFESTFDPHPTFPRAGHLYLASSALGMARAAYEEALAYANERVAWGKPIRQHQLIGRKLLDIRLWIEATRAFIWKMAWALEHQNQPELSGGLSYLGGEATKYYATNNIVQIVQECMQIFGAIGYSKDFPIEKWIRDAIGMSICGTTNEVHSIIISQKL